MNSLNSRAQSLREMMQRVERETDIISDDPSLLELKDIVLAKAAFLEADALREAETAEELPTQQVPAAASKPAEAAD